jgi:ribose 5-phosphate isomerase B
MESENNKIKKLYLATDHAGLTLKDVIKKYIDENRSLFPVLASDVEIIDCGTLKYDAEDDYTVFIQDAIDKLSNDLTSNNITQADFQPYRAIILGGSGQGEAITANRYKGVRAVVYYGENKEIVELGRLHNNANVLSLGARFISHTESYEVVQIFLSNEFEGGRHLKRIENIDLR